MKKSVLLIMLLTMCLMLSGCGGSMISSPEGALPFDQMPPVPPELVEPAMTGNYSKPASNITMIDSSAARIVVKYAIAPGSKAAFEEGLAEKRIAEFSKQYAEGLGEEFTTETFRFFEAQSLMLTGILTKDVEWGKEGDFAVYRMMPYGDYLVMMYAFSKPDEQHELLSMSEVFASAYTANGVAAMQ